MAKENKATDGEQTNEFSLVDIPTEHVQMISNSVGDTYSIPQALVVILNKLNNIEKLIG